jgi:WD40 repeat protein
VTARPAGPSGVETRAELARELTTLRLVSGLTVRELARRLDAPLATVGGYLSGRHLPGPGQTEQFRSLLAHCGVVPAELDQWVEALTRVRLGTDGRVGRAAAPYQGLEPFQAEDAARFFGRAAATEEVLGRLAALRDDPSADSGLLVVVGRSGSGKSSLLHAGVMASVRAGALDDAGSPFVVAAFAPGADPLGALQAALAATSDGGTGGAGNGVGGERRLLLVVDQLEEVFAVPAGPRAAFLAELTGRRPPGCLVVAGLRADFYEAAAGEPALWGALRGSQLLLGPMTEAEVRQVVVEPARAVGVAVEEGLVDLVLADLTPGSPSGFAHEPGALPLLSHALLVTWQRAERNRLTVADYRAAGGLRQAVRQSAEALYGDLAPLDQELARRLLCRLVRVDSDGPPVRRRVAHRELAGLGVGTGGGDTDGGGAGDVVDRFVAARLLTVGAGTLEISHDALATAWPRLAAWIEADRAGLRLHHQLTDAANAWQEAGEDPSLLWRGTRLQVAAEWSAEPGRRDGLSRVEAGFLDAALAALEAERRSARRRSRRMRQLLTAVVALALVASGLAAFALAARATAERTRLQALSRQVAVEATQLRASDPALAMQLALAAYRFSPTYQARSALLDASAYEMPTRLLGPSGPAFAATAANGRLLAVAYSATDQVELSSLGGPRPRPLARLVVGPASGQVFAVALSPSGHLLAAAGTDDEVTLWSIRRVDRPIRLATLTGFTSTVYGLAFDASGNLLAAAGNDGTLRQWSLANPRRPVLAGIARAPGGAPLHAVAFDPAARLVAAGGAGGTLVAWREVVANGPPARAPRLVTRAPLVRQSGTAVLTSLAFSPDGRTLVAGSEDGFLRLFGFGLGPGGALGLRPFRRLGPFSSWVDSVAFGPGTPGTPAGPILAAGSSADTLRLWNATTWAPLATLPDPAPVTGLAFGGQAGGLVSADADGTVRLWSLPPPGSLKAPGSVFSIDYTASGRLAAAVSGGPAGEVSLFDTADPWRPRPAGAVRMPASFGPVAGVAALSPSGHLLAVGNAKADVRLVDLARPGRPRLVGPLLGGAVPAIEQLDFSPNGRILVVGDDAGRIHAFDVADPARPRPLPTLAVTGKAPNVLGVAFSPNGHVLAVASADGKVWLFQVGGGGVGNWARPRHLATLGGFANYAYAVAFTPNGRTLVAGSADGTLRLWDVADPARPRPLGGPLTGPASYVYSIDVSPDGATLAAATTGHGVFLWDIADPARPVALADLAAEAGQVYDVTFSPDGATLAASGADGRLHLWDYHPSAVARRICALAGSPLTRAEWAQHVEGASYDPPCP